MNGACNSILFFGPVPWDPGEGSKGQKSLNFNYKVNLKEIIPKFLCVLTNERYSTYQTGFLFYHLGHAPGVGPWGAGLSRGSFFPNMVMWHIKLTGMTSKTECK